MIVFCFDDEEEDDDDGERESVAAVTVGEGSAAVGNVSFSTRFPLCASSSATSAAPSVTGSSSSCVSIVDVDDSLCRAGVMFWFCSGSF
jgi:hypothetical protein